MHAKHTDFLKYYVRVLDVNLFNAIVATAEHTDNTDFQAERESGYYVLRTNDAVLWHELVLYGQMLAQAGELYIETGQV